MACPHAIHRIEYSQKDRLHKPTFESFPDDSNANGRVYFCVRKPRTGAKTRTYEKGIRNWILRKISTRLKRRGEKAKLFNGSAVPSFITSPMTKLNGKPGGEGGEVASPRRCCKSEKTLTFDSREPGIRWGVRCF